MKSEIQAKVHPFESWRCRECGFVYEEQDYPLPLRQCPRCGIHRLFDRVTEELAVHPGRDLMSLP